MNDLARQFRDFFVSLKLTVVLIVLSLILVFVATLDQVNLGIWAVQEKYFRSLFVLWNVKGIPVPVFPGGYLVGGFLLVNLIAAHVYRFSLTRRKAGIQMTHAGLILLLLGELFTGLLQEDFSMRLEQGVPKSYSESFRENELVVIDTTDPKTDEVVAIPEPMLRPGASLQHPRLPFRLVVKNYYPNSALQMKSGAPRARRKRRRESARLSPRCPRPSPTSRTSATSRRRGSRSPVIPGPSVPGSSQRSPARPTPHRCCAPPRPSSTPDAAT